MMTEQMYRGRTKFYNSGMTNEKNHLRITQNCKSQEYENYESGQILTAVESEYKTP